MLENTSRDMFDLRMGHYEKHFGTIDKVYHPLGAERHVDICLFPPSREHERPHWTLATDGMSNEPQTMPDSDQLCARIEILMYVDEPKDWMLKGLRYLALFPHYEKTFFGWWHTVGHPGQMTDGPSELAAYLLLPPYFEEEGFDPLKTPDGEIRFLWVFPITEVERRFAVDRGGKALEDIIAGNKINPVVDETRRSLV